jgi:DNA-binding MarR family transcriptional regulator
MKLLTMHSVNRREGTTPPASLKEPRDFSARSAAGVRPVPKSTQAPKFVPLARSLGYHVRELSESWQDAMDAAAQAHGVSLTQWRYLRELWETDRLSNGELTMRVGRQGPTTVVAVRSLERAGLVRIEKSRHDRRKTYVCLTARGRRLAEVMSPVIQDVNEAAVMELTADETRLFKRLIVKIQRRLDRYSPSRNSWSLLRTDHLAGEVGV